MNRVLVVEADPTLAEDLTQVLQRAGWAVDLARGAAIGEAPMEGSSPPVVLVDVSSPEGFEALGRLGGDRSVGPLVAMGSGHSPEPAARARRLGARVFLRKPFGLEALEAAFAEARSGLPTGAAADADGPSTRSPAMQRLLETLRAAATTDATIQLVGELGSGKSELARQVHAWSPRRSEPLRHIACADLPADPGQARAAMRGAGGTALLEEVDSLPADLQPVLLEVLQEEPGPDGGPDRFVATTRRCLRAESRAGRFLEALGCRLDVVTLRVPALRERLEDLGDLATSMLERFAALQGVAPPVLSEASLDRLAAHPFPGNLHELGNLMRRAVVLFPGASVDVESLFGRGPVQGATSRPLELDTLNLREIERQVVTRSLAEHGGNRTRASAALGISVRTLRNKIREYGLS
ncbi:MAG: sigma-54-dependent transcriptional regulator [Myxococcota bacterium]